MAMDTMGKYGNHVETHTGMEWGNLSSDVKHVSNLIPSGFISSAVWEISGFGSPFLEDYQPSGMQWIVH